MDRRRQHTIFIRENKGDDTGTIIGKLHAEISLLELVYPNLSPHCRVNTGTPRNYQYDKTEQRRKLGHLLHAEYETGSVFYLKIRVLNYIRDIYGFALELNVWNRK
jgi:hypothetical protein